MKFSCGWDSSTIIWTAGIGILLFFVAVILIRKLIKAIKEKQIWSSISFSAIICLILYLVISGLIEMPLNIELSDNSVKINQLFRSTSIEYNDIKEIRLVLDDDLIEEVRENGSTGFFGDLGKYRSEKLGNYEKFTTNKEDQILIETINNDKYMFSCNTPELLVKMINDKFK